MNARKGIGIRLARDRMDPIKYGSDLRKYKDSPDWSGSVLDYSNIAGADMRGMSFFGSTICRARWSGCDAEGADFGKCLIISTFFVRCDFRNASFERIDGIDPKFIDCDLRGASFRDAVNTGMSYFIGCDLRGASFDESAFSSRFVDCDLRGMRASPSADESQKTNAKYGIYGRCETDGMSIRKCYITFSVAGGYKEAKPKLREVEFFDPGMGTSMVGADVEGSHLCPMESAEMLRGVIAAFGGPGFLIGKRIAVLSDYEWERCYSEYYEAYDNEGNEHDFFTCINRTTASELIPIMREYAIAHPERKEEVDSMIVDLAI
jgi:uncharacterized protein YjbI with pentapeptide repeats